MSSYVYRYGTETLEREFPIGTAPKSVSEKGVIYDRVYTIPVVKQLSPLDRGDKPSISHQLPSYYGYGQRETVWKERMQQLQQDDTPTRRMQVLKAGLGPKPKYIERRSREAAEKAGALDRFDRKGRPIARSKREVGRVLDTAKKVGDALEWS